MKHEKLDDDDGIHEQESQKDARTSPVALPIRDEIEGQEQKLEGRDNADDIQEIQVHYVLQDEEWDFEQHGRKINENKEN